jgi:predicted SAM-dependent methyltransferase
MPLRKARRRFADRASIERYLAGHRPACLHLGCGVHPLSGWLNSDLEPNDPAVIRLDATQSFPFTDAAFDYIFSEHMIEHLPAAGAGSMLAECFRTLKPGGTVRISTPDLAFLLALFDGRPSAIQQEYMEWATRTFVGSSVRPGPAGVLNNFVRNWGHQFIYDEPTLRERLQLAGFVDIVRCELNVSVHERLRGLENESRMPPGYLRMETMTFEASRPRAGGPPDDRLRQRADIGRFSRRTQSEA